MPKGKKITSFFDGRRREAKLRSWEHLKSKAGESRMKLEISVPLLNRELQSLPEAVSKQYTVMCEDKASTAQANLDIYLEGMTLEIFATDESRQRTVASTGVTISKLRMVASGEGEKRTLDLLLRMYMPANVQVRDWAWEHLHATLFIESTYSQSEMEFSTLSSDDGPDDDEEDDEQEESPTAEGNKDIFDFDDEEAPVLN